MRSFLRPARVESARAPLLDEKNEPGAGLDTPRLDLWDDDRFSAYQAATRDMDDEPAAEVERPAKRRRRTYALGAVLLVAGLLTAGALSRPDVWSSEVRDELGPPAGEAIAAVEVVETLATTVHAVATTSTADALTAGPTATPSRPATATPSPQPTADDEIEPEPREACPDGRTDCRFLVLVQVAEQETRAITKIAQVAIFARETNRTLVLPRAYNGRYSVCKSHPFTSYHDIDRVSELLGVRTIAWHDFTAFARQQDAAGARVATKNLFVSVRAGPGVQQLIVQDNVNGRPKSANAALGPDIDCLDDVPLDVHRTPGYFGADSMEPPQTSMIMHDDYQFGAQLVQHAHTDASLAQAQAIFLDWQLAYASPLGNEVLPYSTVLNEAADRIADKLRPYVVLHWRMEAVGISSPDFERCAEQALAKLAGVRDLRHVWFMTDFPLEGYSNPHSATFITALKRSDHYRRLAVAGIDRFLAGFRGRPIKAVPLAIRSQSLLAQRAALLNVTLTSEHLEHARVLFPDRPAPVSLEHYDPGLTGVIDRLVAERADYYIVGEPRVCARASSYIQSIVADRNVRAKRPVDHRRVVDYFGTASSISMGHRYAVSSD